MLTLMSQRSLSLFKGPLLSSKIPPTFDLPHKTFPDESSPQCSVQQTVLVPTLSLPLGLPIPFNNLGTAIPISFLRDRSGSDCGEASDMKARQVYGHLYIYQNSQKKGRRARSITTVGARDLHPEVEDGKLDGKRGLECSTCWNHT